MPCLKTTARWAVMCGLLAGAASARAAGPVDATTLQTLGRGAMGVADSRVDQDDDRLSLYRRAVAGPTAQSKGDPNQVFSRLLVSDPSKPSSVYLSLAGTQGFRDEASGQQGLKFNDLTAWVGVDRRFGDNWLVGAAIGYGGGQDKSSGNVVTADRTSQAAKMYGRYEKGRLFVDGNVFWAWNRYDDIHRTNLDGTISRASTNGTAWGGGVTSGLMFGAGPTRLGPIVGFRATGAQVDGFSENGDSSFNAKWTDQRNSSLSSELGGEIQYSKVPVHWLAPRFRLLWEHRISQTERDLTATLINAPATQTIATGARETDDRVRARISMGGSIAPGLSGGVDYEAAVGGGMDQRMTAQLHVAF